MVVAAAAEVADAAAVVVVVVVGGAFFVVVGGSEVTPSSASDFEAVVVGTGLGFVDGVAASVVAAVSSEGRFLLAVEVEPDPGGVGVPSGKNGKKEISLAFGLSVSGLK